MIVFSIFFLSFCGLLLWRISSIVNESFREAESEEKYKYLYELIICKKVKVENKINEFYIQGEFSKYGLLHHKYEEFCISYTNKFVTVFYLDKKYLYRKYSDNGRIKYPIKDMIVALNEFETYFPEIFKIEIREKQIDSLLGE